MGFAAAWLEKRALFTERIKESPDRGTGIIVVVPAYNEPGISQLLGSLASCIPPGCKVEVIIVINAPADAGEEALLNNRHCIKNIESWKKVNKSTFFRLYVFDAGQPAINGWGVGLARKTGMDEALRRFDALENPYGVIVCLDSDCTVEKNYFASICDEFLIRKERSACSISFEHPLSGNEFPEEIYNHIILYELHLRYYLQGLRYSCFPYPYHTVGSALAVRANQYVRAGGMNRKQAGEDFYFIQKLVPLGGYFNLDSTTVYPSPRESYRVPFGTGATITKLMQNGGQLLLTYNVDGFRELRSLFSTAETLYQFSNAKLKLHYENFPRGLRSFISEEEWLHKIAEIKSNTSGKESFRKRFYDWFNMFRIVKYLNHVHEEIFEMIPVAEAASELLKISGYKLNSVNPKDQLNFFRKIEKGPICFFS
ncbi:MAG: glycosyltransferase family 2 protein [Bacteroidales bacterium]|jgi:hypothetical protein|nr:glycosyltransferase family 2 protein [Bacteroidales bacterium]